MVSLMGALTWPRGVSSSSTKVVSSSAVVWARSWAVSGSGSVTVMSRLTVSGTTVAVTCSESSFGVV